MEAAGSERKTVRTWSDQELSRVKIQKSKLDILGHREPMQVVNRTWMRQRELLAKMAKVTCGLKR
jgi:hypothetical protein